MTYGVLGLLLVVVAAETGVADKWDTRIDLSGASMRASVDLGSVPAGVTVTSQVAVNNPGSQPAELRFKASDCGCATATPKLLVPSGKVGYLEVNLDTGLARKKTVRNILFTVVGAESRYVRVQVLGEVEDALVTPQQIDLGKVTLGTQREVSFQIGRQPGWKLARLEQVDLKGWPDSVGQPVLEGEVLTVAIAVPERGGRGILWKGLLHFEHENGRKMVAPATIGAEIVNPVFVRSSLFCGIVRRSEGLIAERAFEIAQDTFDPDKIRTSDPDGIASQLTFSDAFRKEHASMVTLRMELSENVPNGMNTLFLECPHQSAKESEAPNAVRIPVSVLVLP
jgi:hypothetical protein